MDCSLFLSCRLEYFTRLKRVCLCACKHNTNEMKLSSLCGVTVFCCCFVFCRNVLIFHFSRCSWLCYSCWLHPTGSIVLCFTVIDWWWCVVFYCRWFCFGLVAVLRLLRFITLAISVFVLRWPCLLLQYFVTYEAARDRIESVINALWLFRWSDELIFFYLSSSSLFSLFIILIRWIICLVENHFGVWRSLLDVSTVQ